MNWLSLILKALTLAPYVWKGVETIHADASHETKTQIATQALVQASGVAQVVDPNDTETIQGVTAGVAQIVQGVSQLHKTAGSTAVASAVTPEPNAVHGVAQFSTPSPAQVQEPAASSEPAVAAQPPSGTASQDAAKAAAETTPTRGTDSHLAPFATPVGFGG